MAAAARVAAATAAAARLAAAMAAAARVAAAKVSAGGATAAEAVEEPRRSAEVRTGHQEAVRRTDLTHIRRRETKVDAPVVGAAGVPAMEAAARAKDPVVGMAVARTRSKAKMAAKAAVGRLVIPVRVGEARVPLEPKAMLVPTGA